jgi:hypothetical protein
MYLTVVERCAAAGKVDDLLPQAMLELVQLERIADW